MDAIDYEPLARPFRFPRARRALAVGAALLVSASPAIAEDAAPPFLRTDDVRLNHAIARGLDQSPTFRAIFERLGESDVIVYLRRGSLYGTTAAATQLMTSAGGYRYVRVTMEIDPRTDAGLALLGHELWHVLELAEAPWVTNGDALNALYERIGYRTCGAAVRCYDTEGAVATGYQVLRELRGRRAAPLHALRLPVALREEPRADGRQRDEGDADGDEGASGTEAAGGGEKPRQRYLPQPQDDHVDPRGRAGVAGAVERLGQHHPVARERKAERDDAKAADAVAGHVRVAGENGY
jgi:hypothetical protein